MEFKIKKGFDVGLAGKPTTEIVDAARSATVAVFPLEFSGLKQRLIVAEGDTVTAGAILMEDKANPAFKLRAPAGGRVASIIRGDRRFVEKITIDVDPNAKSEQFASYSSQAISSLDCGTILDQLVTTGMLSLIRQRPFGRMADPELVPKSIFVNAMNTGPFKADAEAVVADDPVAFQAGLDLLGQVTEGAIHLCVGENAGSTLKEAKGVDLHLFSGPHPAGNTSVHISRVDPMLPTDIIWTVDAVDLVGIGRLFLDGALPATRIVAIGGPCVKAEDRRHYRIATGGSLKPILDRALEDGEHRVIAGDVLSGTTIRSSSHLRFHQSAITVIPANKERYFMGWTMPGVKRMSFTRTFASTWLPDNGGWHLGTNMFGEERALVITGHYDKVMPLDIMVDFLIRAVMAGDTDEAIAHGILETLPEDFALCDVICPSKIEVQELIRKGLRQIEEEGI